MNTENKIIAVTGATGQQGGAAARHLLENGWQVRAITRNPNQDSAKQLESLGAEIVQAEHNNIGSLNRVFQDVYGVFSVQGFWDEGVDSEVQQGINIADAAKANNVQHFVYSSVGGADRNTGIPHFESKWRIEQNIAKIGLPATVLRPVEFMENFYWSRSEILSGKLASQGLRSERKKQLIAVDDIGAFVAITFGNPQEYIGKSFEIAGDSLTEQEIAVVFSRVIGNPVQLAQPESDLRSYVRDELVEMWEWFDREGYNADINLLRSIHPTLQTLEDWLKQTGWSIN